MKRAWVAALFLLLAVGCSAPGSSLPPIGKVADGAYRLGAGDRIRIGFVNLEILEGDYVVSDIGTISVPLLGQVTAQGLTPKELEQEIGKQIEAAQVGSDPSVSVQIEQYRPFFILGEVQRPGQYPYVPQMTLKTAVAIAGGYTFRAEEDYAVVTRTVNDEVVEGIARSRTHIMPGDAIEVYESWF